MLHALVMALALTPVPTHGISLHEGGHTSFNVRGSVRSWYTTKGNVFNVERVVSSKKSTRVWIDARGVGQAALVVSCDGTHQEVWLVDVRR